MKTKLTILLLTLISMSSFAQKQDHAELQKMADQDQNSRFGTQIDWKKLNRQDSLRRVRVYELLKNDKVKTAKDFYNAGIILHHGKDTTDSKMAVKNFAKAIAMDSTLNKWWYAAAVDRDLMRRDEPQIYGTQNVSDESAIGKIKRYKMDTTKISDKERRYYSVQTLEEQRERTRVLNLKSISSYYTEHPNLDNLIALIKIEFERGNRASYYISEPVINGFGYALMNKNELKKALRIFKLNTKLYPDAPNTYDSYGECLLKLNKVNEAKKAYKKSVALNPNNENAKNILNQLK